MKIHVIIGSTRQKRFSEKPVRWIYEEAKKRDELDVELVDLREYPLPFFDEPMSPIRMHGKYSNDIANKWARKVAEADGYIIVSPEYNHGYPAVLKNALDVIYKEWNQKPVALVGYGGSAGGGRAVEQLRQVVAELQMVSIRESILIHGAWHVFDEEGNPKDSSLDEKVDSMVKQLLWWTKALKTARENE